MITKELLESVLDISITDDGYFVISDDNRSISIFQDKADFEPDIYINIHELAHKCKEWTLAQGYELRTSTRGIVDLYSKKYNYEFDSSIQMSPPEPEAIFKSCQWILDNKE